MPTIRSPLELDPQAELDGARDALGKRRLNPIRSGLSARCRWCHSASPGVPESAPRRVKVFNPFGGSKFALLMILKMSMLGSSLSRSNLPIWKGHETRTSLAMKLSMPTWPLGARGMLGTDATESLQLGGSEEAGIRPGSGPAGVSFPAEFGIEGGDDPVQVACTHAASEGTQIGSGKNIAAGAVPVRSVRKTSAGQAQVTGTVRVAGRAE